MDVHPLTWANVMLYFQQLLHADVTSSKCRPQRAMGCPRVNAGKWHVVLRQLLHADVTSSKLLPATQEAAPPHIACGPSPAVLARSLQSSRPLPANIDFPVNFHAARVQHTCNTTCNTSTFTVNLEVRLPFLVRLLQSFFVSI